MYILLTDETNQRPSQDARFFVYGGVFFPIDVLADIDNRIENLRKQLGFLQADQLKFDTWSRPKQVEFAAWTQAKSTILDISRELGVKFVVNVIHHSIIKNQDIEQQSFWAADYVIGRFHQFLINSANETGIVLIDNLPTNNQYKYLRDKFSIGLRLPKGRTLRLPQIKMYGTTCISASHANSIMDIVLGSFRYCINNPKNQDAARCMMGKVMDLLWHRRVGNHIVAEEMGLIIRPKPVDVWALYKPDYTNLISQINSLIKEY